MVSYLELAKQAEARLRTKKEGVAPDLEAILNRSLKDLTTPLPVWSDIVGELIYLVSDEATAWQLLAQGKAAYYPEEVSILLDITREQPMHTAKERIRKIHLAKKELGGLVTDLIRQDEG